MDQTDFNKTAGLIKTGESAADFNYQAARQRIIFLESVCMELKAAADQARQEAERSRRAFNALDIRYEKLNNHVEEVEKELLKKGKEIIELNQKVAISEIKRAESDANLATFKKRMSSELQLAKVELDKERRLFFILSSKFEDAQMRLTYLQRSYERLLEKMFELYDTIQTDESEKFDLAEFIAEMRSEIVSLEELLAHSRQREQSLQDALKSNFDSFPNHTLLSDCSFSREHLFHPINEDTQKPVQSFSSQSIDTVDSHDIVQELLAPSDRPLANRYIAELETGPDSIRQYAAVRLIELLGKHAAPFIAQAVHQSSSPVVRAALVTQLAKTRDTMQFHVVMRFMDDPDYTVRIAALDSCCSLASGNKDDWMSACRKGVGDISPFVRRRAAMHAATARTIDPGPLCIHLLSDKDPTTRRIAIASVAATSDPHTSLAVLNCLADNDKEVRSTAAHSIEHIFGIKTEELLLGSALECKIFISRLSTYINESRNTLYPHGTFVSKDILSTHIRKIFSKVSNETPPHVLQEVHDEKQQLKHKDRCKPVPHNTVKKIDFQSIKKIVQSSLSGITDEELCRELSCSIEELSASLPHYIAEGKIIRRGKKLFNP